MLKFKIELGLHDMSLDLVLKFQIICLKGTSVIEWKPNMIQRYGYELNLMPQCLYMLGIKTAFLLSTCISQSAKRASQQDK